MYKGGRGARQGTQARGWRRLTESHKLERVASRNSSLGLPSSGLAHIALGHIQVHFMENKVSLPAMPSVCFHGQT